MEIKYLKHHQIDKQKWDTAIENAQNGLVYALSWFLDIVSPGWEALIAGDYELVMPLTFKMKYGITYLYQPIFIQQLGIFSKLNTSEEIVQEFIRAAKENFKFIEIQLNIGNPGIESENFILRNTQFIDLSKSYHELYNNYSKNLRKNLQKIKESELVINRNGESSDFIDLMSKMFIKKGVDEIQALDLNHLKQIIEICLKKGLGELSFGYLHDNLCASAFFLKWQKRVIIYTALNDRGREVSAMFGIIDKYIHEYAGQDLIFDFAGSNIPGVKYRNISFGAQNEIYYKVKINNLPIPFRWFK